MLKKTSTRTGSSSCDSVHVHSHVLMYSHICLTRSTYPTNFEPAHTT